MRIYVGLMRIDRMNESEVSKLIHDCLDNGLNKFDIADIYGGGKCEELVGEVLTSEPNLREKMYIQTKVGIDNKSCGYNSSYDYIIKRCKECLERLKTTYIDRLLIHRPDIFMDAKEVGDAIKYLMDSGLIKSFGVSNFSQSEIEYLETELETTIECNQVQLGLGNTNMLDQTMYTNVPQSRASKEADSIYFFMKKKKMEIQCWSPFQYGFFEGVIFDRVKYPKLNEVLDKYASKYNTTPCAIASSFLFSLSDKIEVVTGSTNINHILEVKEGEGIKLSKDDWYRIYSETGHILP